MPAISPFVCDRVTHAIVAGLHAIIGLADKFAVQDSPGGGITRVLIKRGEAVFHLLAPVMASLMLLTAPATNVGDVTVSGVTEQFQGDRVQFTGSYPQFSGIQDKDQEVLLNAHMRELEKAALVRAKAAVLELPTGDGPGRSVEGVYGYEVKRNSGGLASLLISDYLYSGGANGLDVRSGITVSTVSGRELRLQDLFCNDASYTDVLNREIRKQLRDRGLEKEQIRPFTGIDEDQNYYLTDTDLVIVARELEWFNHAMGTVEFSIPLSKLQAYMKDSVW